MAPVQDELSPSWTTFWRHAPLRRSHGSFSGSLLHSYFKTLFLSTFNSMLKTVGESCTSSPTTPSPSLLERYFFTVNVRGNFGLPYMSNQLHPGPSHARTGRQRRAGRPRSTDFILPLLNAYFVLFVIQLSKARLVVTNPAVCHGSALLQVGFSALYFVRSVFSVVWVSPCLFHWVPCTRCKLAAKSEA